MKSAETIAVVGIGNLGLCWALTLAKAGYTVIGVDRRVDYLAEIRQKSLRCAEPGRFR